jgi:hypothetical protein
MTRGQLASLWGTALLILASIAIPSYVSVATAGSGLAAVEYLGHHPLTSPPDSGPFMAQIHTKRLVLQIGAVTVLGLASFATFREEDPS